MTIAIARPPSRAAAKRDQQADDARDEHGEDEDERDVPVVVHAVGGDVGADADEEDLPERDLAGVAHDDVEAEDGDREDADAGERLVGEGGKDQRKHDQQNDHQRR